MTALARAGPGEAASQKLHLGPPCGWQRPKEQGHFFCFPLAIGREQLGHESASTWDAGVTGSGFTYYATVLALPVHFKIPYVLIYFSSAQNRLYRVSSNYNFWAVDYTSASRIQW